MRQKLQNGLFTLCCDLALDCAIHWGDDNSIRWRLTLCVYNLKDQNTLPITSKANSNHLLSESKDLVLSKIDFCLKSSSCVWLWFTSLQSGGIRGGNRYLSLDSVVFISKTVSSVGTEPLRHFQFPVEGHSKVLIYFIDSLVFYAARST